MGKGERITAEERGAARKVEERWGATELHKLFPRLIGPPRPRRDSKTMEVVFYVNGYPPGEAIKRKMIAPRLCDDDRICYVPNPKLVGSHSYKLYERYCRAQTVAEAKRLGARGIDFAFDSNWGYLTVSRLSLAPQFPAADACAILDKQCPAHKELLAKGHKGKTKMVKVRLLEMSEGHKGLDVPRKLLSKLAARCPVLRSVGDEKWAAAEGPLTKVPVDVLRVLLRWAAVGQLCYERRRTKAVYNALLKACGNKVVARLVKEIEAKEGKSQKFASKMRVKQKLKLKKKY